LKNVKDAVLSGVALVRADVSEEHVSSVIRVTRIGELGITLAVTSNRCTLRRKPHSIIFQKTAFFIVIAVNPSNLTSEKHCRLGCYGVQFGTSSLTLLRIAVPPRWETKSRPST
jgi:hypothetical protein